MMLFQKPDIFRFLDHFVWFFFKLAFLSDFLLVVWKPNICPWDLFPPSKCRTSVVFEYALYCCVGKMNVQNEWPWKSTKLFAKAGKLFYFRNVIVCKYFCAYFIPYNACCVFWPWVCIVENNEKPLKNLKVPFSLCAREAHLRLM